MSEPHQETTDIELSEEKEITKPSEIAGPPNGDLKAWAQVIAAFSIFLNTWQAKLERISCA